MTLLKTKMPLWKRALVALVLIIAVILSGFAAGVLWPEPQLRPEIRNTPIAIIGVTVVDVASGALLLDQTVVTRGDRIIASGDTPGVQVPADARRIDGRGRYLMPALWDMHTHIHAISPLTDLPMYIAYGVTSVRDLQGCPTSDDPFVACRHDKRRWSQEAIDGERVGPRVIEASSFMANGPGMVQRMKHLPRYFGTANAQEARQFVRHFQSEADSIKVYDNIPRDAYLALADEAAALGIPVVGHRPRAVTAIEAASHQRSIEHARFILHESFDGSAALRAAAGTPAWKEDRRAMVDRHDPAMAQEIFLAMRDEGTYYVPTHITRWADAFADQAEVRQHPGVEYLHPLIKMQWLEDVDATIVRDPGPEARRAYMDFYLKGLELTAAAHAAGVRIMVGTDYIAPGLDVHSELEQLVLAGLTPAQALAAATVVPSEYAGLSALHGSVEAGKTADFILVDGNPLDDIRNTRRIHAVMFDGRLFDSGAIEDIKRHVKGRADSWALGCKIVWRFLRNPVGY